MRGFLRGPVPTAGAKGGSGKRGRFRETRSFPGNPGISGNRAVSASSVPGPQAGLCCLSTCSGRNPRLIARGIPARVRKTCQAHDGVLNSLSPEVAMWDLPPSDIVLYGLSLVALAAQAMTAALAAGRRSMDWVGVCLLGCITALGGGTIRDVLLGHYPLLWVQH